MGKRVAKERRIRRKARKARQKARWREAFSAALRDEDYGIDDDAVFPRLMVVRELG